MGIAYYTNHGLGGNARDRRKRRRAQEAVALAVEEGGERWLAALYDDCRCCARCGDRPCGGCQKGSVCDDWLCTCDDEPDEDSYDEDSYEVRADIADMEAEYRRSLAARGEVARCA